MRRKKDTKRERKKKERKKMGRKKMGRKKDTTRKRKQEKKKRIEKEKNRKKGMTLHHSLKFFLCLAHILLKSGMIKQEVILFSSKQLI